MTGSPDIARAAAALTSLFAGNTEEVNPHIAYAVAHLLQSLGTVQETLREPEKRSRKRRLPKHCSREEVAALFGQPNLRAPTGLRDRCMMELMYRAGLRVSEVCALLPRDVYLVDKEGRVRVVDGKSGDGMAYFDPESVWQLLERWKAVRSRLSVGDCPWLFCTVRSSRTRIGGPVPPGRPVQVRAVQIMMERRSRKAGITKVTPHMLRHTFATELLDEGFTIREVQALMRHRNLRTTEIYLHLADSKLGVQVAGRKRAPEE